MNLQLEDKTALVSGSSQGIGFAIAEALAKEGAAVVINSNKQDLVDEAIGKISKTAPGAHLIAAVANNWRDEMLKVADGYVKESDVKQYIKEFKVYNSGQDVAQQIAQIRQAILSGVDAIIVNAAQPSGLDPILEEVAKRGIVIVAFDNTVTSKRAVNINNDQFQMGKRWAEFLAEQTKGKGTVLMVRGLAGTPVDNQQASGAKSVFEKYPGLKIV